MGMESSGLSVADALALQDRGRNDGDMWGGGGMWMMMFLFFILALGGNGFGGFGNNGAQGALTRAELADGFNFNNIENGIRGIQSGICDSTFALNNTMQNGFFGIQNGLCNGFNSVNAGINQARFDAQQCLKAVGTCA